MSQGRRKRKRRKRRRRSREQLAAAAKLKTPSQNCAACIALNSTGVKSHYFNHKLNTQFHEIMEVFTSTFCTCVINKIKRSSHAKTLRT